jgi:hypothetical protein
MASWFRPLFSHSVLNERRLVLNSSAQSVLSLVVPRAPLAVVIGALLLPGCATPVSRPQVDFISFEEPQRNWPTHEWGLMHRVDGFPIYALNQLPPAPYEIRGFIYTAPEAGESSAQLESAVVRQARREGGEAAMVTREHARASPLDRAETDYLVIQFKTNALASVLDRINIYLALQPATTNAPGQDAGANREQLETLKQLISRHSPPPHSEAPADPLPRTEP